MTKIFRSGASPFYIFAVPETIMFKMSLYLQAVHRRPRPAYCRQPVQRPGVSSRPECQPDASLQSQFQRPLLSRSSLLCSPAFSCSSLLRSPPFFILAAAHTPPPPPLMWLDVNAPTLHFNILLRNWKATFICVRSVSSARGVLSVFYTKLCSLRQYVEPTSVRISGDHSVESWCLAWKHTKAYKTVATVERIIESRDCVKWL